MKERIFTTKEQGRVLVEAGLPISTAIGFRDKYLDRLHSMEDNAGIVMEKLILNDIQDLWRWREKINIDDFKEEPMGEDMPLYFPCAVVWHVDYGEHDDNNYICYGFVYVAEILGI